MASPDTKRKASEEIDELLAITEKINSKNDLDSLLDSILFEARKFTRADAGSIFLRNGESLYFSYVQNDTLEKTDETSNRYIYSTFSIPINEKSIAGHVALTGKSLIIDDVYALGDDVPYSFNADFDKLANYKTKSVLTIPLINSRETVTGVMQIINSKDDKGEVRSFTHDHERYVSFFANNASIAIEKAKMTRETILRMIKMAELRDPKETGPHVNRVGSIAIEVYTKWARVHKIDETEIKKHKDILRIAAMLHDVGKVAISDTILKKPSKLDDAEYRVMKTHSEQGARLFEDPVSDFDQLSAEIAHSHHEKWDGTGYPRGLKGDQISVEGRITALADVYDALICRRCYKEPWPEVDVLNYLKEQGGKHFDPEIVDIFISIYDIIKAIREKYPD